MIAPSAEFNGTNLFAFGQEMIPRLSYDSNSFWNHVAMSAGAGERLAVLTGGGMMEDVDEACMRTIAAFQNHPLIPKDVVVSGWVWEVETRRLRAPTRDAEKRARTDVTAAQFGISAKQPPRWAA